MTLISDGTSTYARQAGFTGIPDMAGWKPYGALSVDHFAQNINPGTTNMATAMRNVALYAHALYAASVGQGWATPVSLGGRIVAVGYNVNGGVDLRGLEGIEFYNGAVAAVGSWPTNAPLFNMSNNAGGDRTAIINFRNLLLKCGHKAAGMLFNGSDQCSVVDVHVINQVGYGIRSIIKNGEFRLTRVLIKQWEWGEVGYDIQANRTALGFDMNTADFTMVDCVACYCLKPFFKGDGFNWQVTGSHFYNGALNTSHPSYDGTSILTMDIQGPMGGVVTNIYSDRGAIRVNCDTLNGSNAFQLSGVNHATGGAGDPSDYHLVLTSSIPNNTLVGLSLMNHRFPDEDNCIRFVTSGGGSFMTPLSWELIGCVSRAGGTVTGITDCFNFGGRFRTDALGNFHFGRFGSATLNSPKDLTLMADYDNNSSAGESRLLFGTDGAVRMSLSGAGVLNIAAIPTSATGLVAGDVWSDAGTLKIA